MSPEQRVDKEALKRRDNSKIEHSGMVIVWSMPSGVFITSCHRASKEAALFRILS